MRQSVPLIAVLLLIACFCVILAGCAFGSPGPLPNPTQGRWAKASADGSSSSLSRMRVTSLQELGGKRQSNQQILDFDETGLPIQFTIQADDTEKVIPVSYTRNEQGDPIGILFSDQDDPISLLLENHYENGELTEVVITEFRVNGASLQESGASGQPSSVLSTTASNLLLRFLHYTGYRNCRLRVDGTDIELCFEQGRIRYSNLNYGTVVQETTNEFGRDGSQRSTVNVYFLDHGKKRLQSSTVTLTDAAFYERETSVTTGTSGSAIQMTYRYEDSIDPETGEAMQNCYFDQISIPNDAATDTLSQQLEQLRSVPLKRIYLNEAGNITRREQTDEYAQLMGGQKTTVWFDEFGRVTKEENRIARDTQLIVTTTEYEYRS